MQSVKLISSPETFLNVDFIIGNNSDQRKLFQTIQMYLKSTLDLFNDKKEISCAKQKKIQQKILI